MPEVPLYAKQPIFNRDLTVIGYELLFRPQDQFDFLDGSRATAQVLLNVFAGDDPVINNESLAIYINCTSDWVINGLPFDRDNLVLEVLEDTQISEPLVRSIKLLKTTTTKVALDDFDLTLDVSALLPYADIVKIDFLSLSRAEIEKTIHLVSRYNVQLLAEKVETNSDYLWAVSKGFELFQGYFFKKPQLEFGSLVVPSKLSTLSLLAELSNTEPNTDDIVNILKNDPIVTTKLLKIVNNSRYARNREISNLTEAVVLLGLDNLRKFITLIALTELSDKPAELMRVSLVTAVAMENIAQFTGVNEKSDWFFIGFLANLDALFNQPLEMILNALPLKESTKRAVLLGEGDSGVALKAISNFTEAAWSKFNLPTISNRDFLRLYLESEEQAELIMDLSN